ncbi:IclR family transcriptional regulator [Desulfuromonas sp. TF]|uniref:IclR family transcriptional regulator n=1 Tax=Desulfuromonas sp. TF TaxID=1232410 RepID=UPI0004000598|nr:IclR family transcriptional regulator [Desulfuromonas sp. TF]
MDKIERQIKSVEYALNVLEVLGEVDGNFRLARLSEKLNMNKSLVYRILTTFERRGYVEKVKSSKEYRLGLGAYEVGQKFLSRMELLHLSKPVMEGLVRECDETVYLALPTGLEILFLEKIDTSNPVSTIPLVGKRYFLFKCAAGKITLSFDAVLRRRFTEEESSFSVENMDDLREQGFCHDYDILGEGVASLAVPLLNEAKKVVASLCLVGPQYRFTDEKIHNEFLPALKAAGQILSCRLGYLGYYLS